MKPRTLMIPVHEKIFLVVIFGILAFHVIMHVGIPTVISQTIELQPVPMGTVYDNGTVIRNMVIPERTPILEVFFASFDRLVLPLAVAFVGIGIWLPFEAIRVGQFPNNVFQIIMMYVFWLLSFASIFLIVYSKGLPVWKKGVYSYLISFLISGAGITYFTNFGA